MVCLDIILLGWNSICFWLILFWHSHQPWLGMRCFVYHQGLVCVGRMRMCNEELKNSFCYIFSPSHHNHTKKKLKILWKIGFRFSLELDAFSALSWLLIRTFLFLGLYHGLLLVATTIVSRSMINHAVISGKPQMLLTEAQLKLSYFSGVVFLVYYIIVCISLSSPPEQIGCDHSSIATLVVF